jgi:hypothetical protein
MAPLDQKAQTNKILSVGIIHLLIGDSGDSTQYRVAMATVQHLATAMDTGQCRVPHTDRRRVTNGPLRG